MLLQYDDAPVDFTPGGFPQRKGEIYGNKVRMVLTEVVNDSNIQYLNPDDDDEPGVELYVTQVSPVYNIPIYHHRLVYNRPLLI